VSAARRALPSLARTGHLARARFAMLRRSGWPIPAVVFLAALSSVIASLAGELLPPFPYAFLALSLGPLVLGLPILSDLVGLLRHDEGLEWVSALPTRPAELTLARTAHLGAWLGALALAWFIPWSGFAPAGLGLGARLALPLLGFLLALGLATALIWAQQVLLARLAGLWVALETLWMVLAVVGILRILGGLPAIAAWSTGAAGLALLPSTWFARALVEGGHWWWTPAALGFPCLLALLRVPASEQAAPTARGGLERWLAPLRWLALRFWVRSDERGPFELVFRGPGREREFALRTYPMIGIPLAFLWLGASGGSEHWRTDVLALLLFTSGVSLPLLLVHLPLTQSPGAAWIQRLAPLGTRSHREGAIKAVFVRWVVPLYVALLAIGLGLGRGADVLRLWAPALLLALLLVRWLYPRCVRDLPLSTAPDELPANLDWAGPVTTLALGLTILAVLANRMLDWGASLALTLFLVALEGWKGRRRSPAGR